MVCTQRKQPSRSRKPETAATGGAMASIPEVSDPEEEQDGTEAAAHAEQEREKQALPSVIVGASLTIKAGDSVALFGPAGSGKTFLLQSLLGETLTQSGVLTVRGSTAYYPEEPLFAEDSVLQNVVCGRRWDSERYRWAVSVAKLERYTKRLRGGDSFVLRNNAGNLYYKLRKRIMLARLLYDVPEIVIFDGFLDDEDAEYRRYVCRVVFGELGSKLRADGAAVTLLVSTDREDVCQMLQRVIVLRDGRVVSCCRAHTPR